jgi:hypothetical protein
MGAAELGRHGAELLCQFDNLIPIDLLFNQHKCFDKA